MSYDENVREEARQLYMGGKTKKEIQKLLNIGSNVTVLKWSRDGNWEEERRKYHDEVLRERLSQRVDEMISSTRGTLSGLQVIKDRAIASIMPDSDGHSIISPQKFGEASDAFMGSAKLERQIKSELISLELILAVANILQEEIDDPEVLNRIGRRLGLLVRSSQIERNALPIAQRELIP